MRLRGSHAEGPEPASESLREIHGARKLSASGRKREHGKMSREFLTVLWDMGHMGRKRGACQRYGQERRTLEGLPQWHAAGQDSPGREYACGVIPGRQLGWYRRISGPLGDGSPAFFMALLAWFHKRRISICAAYGYGR